MQLILVVGFKTEANLFLLALASYSLMAARQGLMAAVVVVVAVHPLRLLPGEMVLTVLGKVAVALRAILAVVVMAAGLGQTAPQAPPAVQVAVEEAAIVAVLLPLVAAVAVWVCWGKGHLVPRLLGPEQGVEQEAAVVLVRLGVVTSALVQPTVVMAALTVAAAVLAHMAAQVPHVVVMVLEVLFVSFGPVILGLSHQLALAISN